MAINFPTSPTNGQVYTYAGRQWVYSTANGTWGAAYAATPIFFSQASAPSGAKEGDEWYDESTGIFYRYIYDGDTYQWVEIGPSTAGSMPLRGHLSGLTLSNNVSDANNDIDIASGVATDSTFAVSMPLTSGLTKRLDANWAVGTNQGGLDTSSKANSTWYHLWLIMRPDTGVVDALFSTSATSPTMPTNYTYKRRLGSVVTDGSGNIRAFFQIGDEFMITPVVDYSTTVSSAGTTITLTRVPTGVKVLAHLAGVSLSGSGSWSSFILISPDVASAVPVENGIGLWVALNTVYGSFQVRVFTNASAQVHARCSINSSHLNLNVHGWTDRRGRDD
jgi:hypothetical protein